MRRTGTLLPVSAGRNRSSPTPSTLSSTSWTTHLYLGMVKVSSTVKVGQGLRICNEVQSKG